MSLSKRGTVPLGGWSRHAAAAEAARRFARLSANLCAALCLTAVAPLAGAAAFDLKKVEAGVYKVYSWRFRANKGMGVGTAFLVSGRRTLITNYHVVDNGEKFFLGYRSGQLGKLVEARLLERRAPSDLARARSL